MERRRPISELAGLLDGEVRDRRQLEELNALIATDPEAKAEYELQRAVKTVLGALPEEEAPAYLDTRVMGEIGGRRGLGRTYRLRTWGAALAGFAICLLAVATYWQWPRPASQPSTASSLAEGEARALFPAGIRRDTTGSVVTPDWEAITVPANGVDPVLTDFLEFARDQHGYAIMVYSVDSLSPDLPAAVLVVEKGKVQ